MPAAEIPRPAKLKAPKGTPRQEAAVVRHQLLVARHLLSTKSTASAAAPVHRPFPHPPSLEASGVAPLQVAHLGATVARVSVSQSDMPLLVGGPLGGFLALSAAAGAFTFRRRRRVTAPVSSDVSS